MCVPGRWKATAVAPASYGDFFLPLKKGDQFFILARYKERSWCQLPSGKTGWIQNDFCQQAIHVAPHAPRFLLPPLVRLYP